LTGTHLDKQIGSNRKTKVPIGGLRESRKNRQIDGLTDRLSERQMKACTTG